jgi:hypothetical protein
MNSIGKFLYTYTVGQLIDAAHRGVKLLGRGNDGNYDELRLGGSHELLVVDGAAKTALDAIVAKLIAAPATEATLAQVVAKLIVAPATEAKQDAANAILTLIAGYTDGIEALLTTLGGKDFATQTTLAAILVKLADPATQTTLAAVLAKLSADPATQTTLAAVLAKLSADPATQTTLAAVLSAVQAAIPAGTNIIGKIGLVDGSGNALKYGPDSFNNNKVTIADTATPIVSALAGRESVCVTILGTEDIYVGSAGLTAGGSNSGDLILGTRGSFKSFPGGGALYGICATGKSCDVSYIEAFAS